MTLTRRTFHAWLLGSTSVVALTGWMRRGGGVATGGGGATLGTLTLVNDGGTTYGAYTSPANMSAAGVPTRLFGWVFKPGALRPYNGEFPKFTVGGVEQLYSMTTAASSRFWPPGTPGDTTGGSLMWAAFSLLPTFSGVAANGGTQTVQITKKTGASWPATPSGFNTLTAIQAQNLGLWAPVDTIDAYEPGTNWAAMVESGNSKNIRQTSKWMQGPAGDVFIFTVDFAGGVSGSFATPASTLNSAPHGLLAADLFIHAMADGSGNFGGLRFCADQRQPYIDGPVTQFVGGAAHVGNGTKDFRYFVPPSNAYPTAGNTGFGWTAGGNIYAPPNWPFQVAGYSAPSTYVQDASFTGTITSASASASAGGTTVFNNGSPSNLNFQFQFNGTITGTIQSGMVLSDLNNSFPAGTFVGPLVSGTTYQLFGNTTALAAAGTSINPTDTINMNVGVLSASGGSPANFGDYIKNSGGTVVGHLYSNSLTQLLPGYTVSGSQAMTSGYLTINLSPTPPLNDGTGSHMCPFKITGTSNFGGLGGGGDGLYWYTQNDANGPRTGFTTQAIPPTASQSYLAPGSPSGTATATAIHVSEPGMRLSVMGADGEYIFYQGTGSIAADTPLRSGIVDQLAWLSSMVIPPFAISPHAFAPTIGSSGSTAEVQPYYGSFGYQTTPGNYTYWPYAQGSNDATSAGPWIVGGGTGQYLQTAPLWTSSDFWGGDQHSYFQVIMAGLGWGTWLSDYVMSTNPTTMPNTGNNKTPAGATRSYVGMGPSTPFAGGLQAGPVNATQTWPGYTPPTNSSLVGINPNQDRAHSAEFVGWAYLRTGRPELLMRLWAEAFCAMAGSFSPTVNTVVPGKTYQNTMVSATGGQIRAGTAVIRWLAWAALLCPSDPSGLNNTSYSTNGIFNGSQVDKYLFDSIDDNFAVLNDFRDPAYALSIFPVPTLPGASFTGSISGNTLTVTGTVTGTILINRPLADVAGLVAPSTYITAQTGGTTGGAGTYTVQAFTNGTFSNNPQTVGSSAMFSGTPALVANDKEMIYIPSAATYYTNPNTFCEGGNQFGGAACPAIVAGSSAAAKFMQWWAQNSQAYADRRGGRINLWTYYWVLPGGSGGFQATPADTDLFNYLGGYSGTPTNSLSYSNVGTPSPTNRAFSMSYSVTQTGQTGVTNSKFQWGNGDYLQANGISGLSGTVYAIADFNVTSGDAANGTASFNLVDVTGAYAQPTTSGTFGFSNYRWNGYNGRNSLAWIRITTGYIALYQYSMSWALALVNAGFFTDPSGYINNAVQDALNRIGASTFANFDDGGQLYVSNLGPSVDLMTSFTP